MKNGFMCLAGLALASAGGQALAQEGFKIGVENETSLNSKFLWRGLVVDKKPAIQSNNTIYMGSVFLNVWSTGRTWRPAIQAGSDEVDYTFGWDTTLGPVNLVPHFTYFQYPKGSGPDSAELGLWGSMDVGKGFTLFSNHYYDVKSYKGGYFGEAGASFDKELAPNWSFGASMSLGWGNAKFNLANLGITDGALSVASGQLSLTYRLGGAMYVRPRVTISSLMGKRVRSSVEKPDNVVWGVAFGLAP
jgi:hypothetical protein